VTPIGAVLVATVALPAQEEEPPAAVIDTLNLPQIVHSRRRPPGTRPPLGTCATTLASNASTRGDPGVGGCDSGPFFLMAVVADPPTPARPGPTTRSARPAQISALLEARRHALERHLVRALRDYDAVRQSDAQGFVSDALGVRERRHRCSAVSSRSGAPIDGGSDGDCECGEWGGSAGVSASRLSSIIVWDAAKCIFSCAPHRCRHRFAIVVRGEKVYVQSDGEKRKPAQVIVRECKSPLSRA
jgi:hypothetical protein